MVDPSTDSGDTTEGTNDSGPAPTADHPSTD